MEQPEIVLIKEEATDEANIIDVYERKIKVKCGEVFSIFGEDFILVCTFCNANYKDMITLGDHLRECHTDEFSLKCSDDDVRESGSNDRGNCTTEVLNTLETDVTRKDLEEHSEDIDLENITTDRSKQLADGSSSRFYCNMCNASYKNKRNLKRHQTKTGCMQTKRVKTENYNNRKIHIEIVATGEEMDIELKSEETLLLDNNQTENEEAVGPNSDDYERFADDSLDDENFDNGDEVEPKRETSDPLVSNFQCSICDAKFKSKLSLSNHRRRHRSEQCNTRTTTATENATSTTKNPDLFCDLCNVYFKNRPSLYIHVDEHIDTLPRILQDNTIFLKCKYCGQQCSKYADRLAHEQKHTGKRPYECPYCRKGFVSNMSRNNHLRLHTGESPFQCGQCSRAFRDKFDLRRHLDRHLNIRKETCEICNKKFFNKHQLTLHMRTHTKERPYVCEDCGKTFVVLPQLKDHQLRHTGVKNVVCEVCDRRFYSKSVLKVHMASHSDEKPFECNVCGRRFSRAKAMQKHMKLHSGVKKYVCNICGKAYAQDSGLYAHKKTHAKQM